MTTWMLYGANGYTGELIAREAARRGLKPILAGRRAEAVAAVAEPFGFETRIFALDDPAAIARELEDVSAILLCAGPFITTSEPVVTACLRTGTHYLDITGELDVFEACHRRDRAAKSAGCALLPGVGFDVVPSDCLAASLAAALPGASELELAFSGVGTPSKGTLKTMVTHLPEGAAVRRAGRIESIRTGELTREVPFRDRARHAVAIQWGDVSTAFYSTGIGDITVYLAADRRQQRMMRMAQLAAPLLRVRRVARAIKRLIDARVTGPDEHMRQTAQSQLWGRVATEAGESVEGTLVTPEAYRLTVLTATDAAERVARGDLEPGAHTPSAAFGAGYITEFDGCDLQIGDAAPASAGPAAFTAS